MRPTVTKFSKLEPDEENTHESCAKLGNRVTKTPRGRCHPGLTRFEKSAFIAVFYWLVKDRPVINPLAPYLIRKGTNSASF